MTWHVATVHEDILASTVAVEVAEYLQVTLLGKIVAQLLRGEDGWMKHLARTLPAAVQVTAGQRASIIAIDDTVWVEHGHDLEYEVLAQVLGLDRA